MAILIWTGICKKLPQRAESNASVEALSPIRACAVLLMTRGDGFGPAGETLLTFYCICVLKIERVFQSQKSVFDPSRTHHIKKICAREDWDEWKCTYLWWDHS